MDIRNCKRCGNIFNYEGSKICLNCRRKEEENFQIVKEFLDINPGASVPVVVEETGVSMEQIMEFLREDRLEIRGEAGYVLQCESCGEKIPSGRFCPSCIHQLQTEIKEVTKKDVPKPKKRRTETKFRIADRYTDKK